MAARKAQVDKTQITPTPLRAEQLDPDQQQTVNGRSSNLVRDRNAMVNVRVHPLSSHDPQRDLSMEQLETPSGLEVAYHNIIDEESSGEESIDPREAVLLQQDDMQLRVYI